MQKERDCFATLAMTVAVTENQKPLNALLFKGL
jgi:hypothetical protein